MQLPLPKIYIKYALPRLIVWLIFPLMVYWPFWAYPKTGNAANRHIIVLFI